MNIPISPHKQFRPKKLIMPIEAALDGATGITRDWLLARIEKGDPGPVFIFDGEMFTEMSEAEE